MNKKNSLVSVIIPAYNHEKYIQDTIKSIINQTYENIELLVIDDGSEDSTWKKIQELEDECKSRFARVFFETKENEGACVTLNKLLSKTKGEYIYIIASDDMAMPQAIEKQLEFLSNNKDYSLCVGNNRIIDSEGKVCYWDENRDIVYDEKKAKYLTFADFLQHNNFNFNSNKFGTYETLYCKNYIPNGYLIRKSIFDIIGFYTQKAPLEDWWLMLQISKYSKMKYLNEIFFSYRWHLTNTIKNSKKIAEYVKQNRIYEEETLSRLKDEKVFSEVLKIKAKGALAKAKGIPYIIEIQKHIKGLVVTKIIKLFNITVFKWVKNR